MQTNKKCYLCKYFDRYYTKGTRHFKKTGFGWCCNRVCTVNTYDSCEQFCLKARSKRNYNLLRYSLNDLLTEISEIREILEHED